MMNLEDLLHKMIEVDASDLHIKAGSPPGFRVHGELVPVEGYDKLDKGAAEQLIDQLLKNEEHRKRYEDDLELDFSTAVDGLARFRVNLFHQRGSRAAVLRQIPVKTPVLEELGFPPIVKTLSEKPRGLVLVTGPTGSGKSTTLASMIDHINRTEHGHILTLEDPIEFIHQDKQCYVNQREIGADSRSFNNALRGALREDPDIILVGEMRDLETIGLAITAAETGHLVFGTLHTTSAIQTVDRIIDVFPTDAQQQVRTQMSNTLQGVISQTLLKKIGGGRAAAQEIMVGTAGVRNLIREGKTAQLLNLLQTGAQHGMQTLEGHLEALVVEGKVAPMDALGKANNPQSLRQALERKGVKIPESPMDRPQPSKPRPSTQELAQRLAQATGRKVAPPPSQPPQPPQPPQPEKTPEPVVQSAGGAADDFEAFRKQRQR